jgi:hypothetical protein
VNIALVVLSDCETNVGSWVNTRRAYSLTASRGPPACISLVPVELSERDGVEGAFGMRGLQSASPTHSFIVMI